MTATAAEIRAWALDQGWDIPEKGRLPEDLRHAYAAARDDPGPAGDPADLSGADEPPDFTADPEPAKAPKGAKVPRERRPKITDSVRRDIRGKVSLMLMMPAAVFARRDEVCGPVLLGQIPEIADALTEVLIDSPDVVAFFTAAGGRYMKWVALGTALEPVATVAWQHHVARRDSRGGGPGQSWNGETVPPDMSRYHAPAL
jgi:hypothetical protein